MSIFNLERSNPSSHKHIQNVTFAIDTGDGRDVSREVATEEVTHGNDDTGSGSTPSMSDDEDYGLSDGFAGSGYNETGSV